MQDLIFRKLREKGIENNIDIFEVNNNGKKVIINYFDGEMDIEQHELKEKTIEVDLWITLDDVINKIKSKIPTKENHEQEPNKKDLLKELLNNPRVESISINIERLGDVEATNINAKLKDDSKEAIKLNGIVESLQSTIKVLCNTIEKTNHLDFAKLSSKDEESSGLFEKGKCMNGY